METGTLPIKIKHAYEDEYEKALFLGLGSNLGNREKNIWRAVDELDKELVPHSSWSGISDIIETEPWGFESENKFLNAVVRYDLIMPYGDVTETQEEFDEIHTRKAREILKLCKRIERKMGRRDEPEYDAEGRRIYKSRKIDIDILLFDDIKIDEPDLKIPHPLIALRPFVLTPLLQLAPDLREKFK